MRFFFSYGIALLVVLLVAGWLASGTLIMGGRGPGQGERAIVDVIEGDEGPLRSALETVGLIATHEEEDAEAAEASETIADNNGSAPPSVRVVEYAAQVLPIEVPLRGRTAANARIAVRAETNGVVQQVHVTRGETVEAGALLCTLDQGTRRIGLAQAEAGLAQAEAALAQAQADLETNAALIQRNLAAANTARALEVGARSAEAQLTAAQLTVDEAQAELRRTEIRTEVAGIVQDPLANVGDTLSPGTECATLVQLDPIRFQGQVAEARIGQVRPGMPARIRTITGQTVEGTVSFVGASADASTRTFAVEVLIDNPDGALLDGVTAEAVIAVDSVAAHLLPQSAMTLGTDGTLGVQTLDGERAAFRAIEILRDTAEGVWVAGLPETAAVITVGQEYVVDGQTVSATVVDPSGGTRS